MDVLVVEDSKSIKKLYQEINELENINANIDFVSSLEELKKINKKYDKSFLDVLLKDGEQFSEVIKKAKNISDEIYIVTAFDEDYVKKYEYNDYIQKDPNLYENIASKLKDEEDFLDFSDFDDEEINEANKTHRQIDAKTYILQVDNTQKEKAKFLKEKFDELEILDEYGFEEHLDEIEEVLGNFIFILDSEYFDLVIDAIYNLIDIIDETDVYSFSHKDKINFIAYLRAIFKDMSNWIESVYIKQNAIDIAYLNASLIFSIKTLRKFLKENHEKGFRKD